MSIKGLTIFLLVFLIVSVYTSCKKEISSGMIAYYEFDGDATDKGQMGHHGIIHGASLVPDKDGKQNSAYRFNGLTDYILVDASGFPRIESAMSFSWWFKIDTLPEFEDEWGAGNMFALVDTGGGIGVQVGFRGPGYQSRGLDTWNWGGKTLLEVDPPLVKIWHHCVYVYDGETHRFYLNGQERSDSHQASQSGQPTQLMFGNYPTGDQYFQGCLDEIRIFNRALSPSEINSLFMQQE